MFEMSIELATGWIALVAVIFLASMAGAELAANDVKPSRRRGSPEPRVRATKTLRP
jgi:hypothetical protein